MDSVGRHFSAAVRTCTLAALALAPACGPGDRSGSYPSAPIELVVPFQPGGGSDTMARIIQSVIAQDGLAPVPVNVVNRAGGAGAVGMAYVASKRGDTHTMMTMMDSMVSVPLQRGYTGPTYRDLTVLAILATDSALVAVPAASPFQTIDALVAFAKAHPGRLKLATSAAGGEDHIFGGLVESATGATFSYVHTRGGSEAMQNLVGGHVDLATPNPSETLSQVQGGLVRALAVAAAARLPILPDVPTLKERGIDVEYHVFRGLAMPAGMPADAPAFWEEVLRKVTASERWRREYIDRLALSPELTTGAAALERIASTEETYRTTLRALGVIQ
jgi:putative tricarboxylic transport membrane protein